VLNNTTELDTAVLLRVAKGGKPKELILINYNNNREFREAYKRWAEQIVK
jgi:hypothetical protein